MFVCQCPLADAMATEIHFFIYLLSVWQVIVVHRTITVWRCGHVPSSRCGQSKAKQGDFGHVTVM